MKILIVDDKNEKAAGVKASILSTGDISEEAIISVPSINDAIIKLRKEKYSLMIVDMCLPETYSGKLLNDGGLKLITILEGDKRIFAPNEIIVLTAHDDLITSYKKAVGEKSFDIINYSDSSEEWKQKINDKIRYLIRCKNSPNVKREYNYDVAILTAVPIEKQAIQNLDCHWKKTSPIEGDSTTYYECIWRGQNRNLKIITTSLTQMGMVPATALSMKLITNFSPRYIIMPGIAGGVKDEYEFGDIIIPREVKDYCSGKYTTPKSDVEIEEAKYNPLKFFIPSAQSISTDADIINIFTDTFDEVLSSIYKKWPTHSDYKPPRIRTGYMASGDSVVQNGTVIDLLIKSHLRNADGLDMEAYGMYYAAQQSLKPKPIPICMKGISDFSNKDKDDKHQAYAAYISAEFLKYLVVNILQYES